MISDKAKISIKTSNPVAAIKQLEGKSFRVHGAHPEGASGPNSTVLEEIDAVLARASAASAGAIEDQTNQPPTSQETLLDQNDQNQQLLQLLKEKERILAEQDADYHVRVWNWQQSVAKSQKELDQRQADLDQQEVQLRLLQFELLQLQNDLIDSQLATREIVSDLSMPGQEAHAIQALKVELNQRFDHVMVTWRSFANEMQQLAQSLGTVD